MTATCPIPSPLALVAAAMLFLWPVPFPAEQANKSTAQAAPVPWDTAFHDSSANTPIHFVAHYLDARGASHRLEEWRVGAQHLRRETDDRIDLHADATTHPLPGQPIGYVWHILDLQKHVASRVSTAGMLHLGMLYSYYAMAHLLTRPPGSFTVQPAAKPVPAPAIAKVDPLAVIQKLPPCTWWQIDAPGQPSTRACWIARYGVPAETWTQAPDGWRLSFFIESLDTRPIPAGTFATNTTGFQVRDVDQLQAED